ncbi:hypothetical protein [Prosthecobacter sp.]|uniref:hypothetical protein n=1 Tax=Prosthecobacter sp. TaxID=1965333 RepID=UPI002AB92371|nr:hypothetical protein [Prosthecobacter sp.]MDZ4402094.1 hypothetical protein [Prosthecobacter sp.]
MPYDPNIPANGTDMVSAEMRSQFQGLKTLIDANATVNGAQVDGVTTVNPGDPATVTLTLNTSTLHFVFEIPRGNDGNNGADGSNGSDGGQGQQGIQGEPGLPGAPGEVSLQQLTDAIATTSSNSNQVATLGMTVSDPPTQAEMQDIANKIDELIVMLRR